MALSRKQSREIAFRLIFGSSEPDTENLELATDGVAPDGCELEYIKSLVCACLENIEQIDEIITRHSKDFAFDRIFKTDLAALRMGIAEVRFFGNTPPVVAVNEAVEIAKKYGTKKSGGFVNGILAAIL